jgi:hypothetical protein
MDQNCPDLSNRKITGTAHLIDVNNRSLIENTVWDLLISVLVIGIIMGIVYKSWRMIPLTILPNLFPLLIVAGIMGFTGIPLKVSTSIIFNIAFGIAVDDTIHFLARVRSLLGEGLSVNYAVKRTFLTTGKAMIVTTLILSGGFLTLIFSDFLGTHYIGLAKRDNSVDGPIAVTAGADAYTLVLATSPSFTPYTGDAEERTRIARDAIARGMGLYSRIFRNSRVHATQEGPQ